MWRLTSSRGRALGRQNLSRVSASALANAACPDPPPAELCSDGDLVGGSQTIAADDAELVVPSLCGGRGGADGCHAVFTWIEAQRWTDVLRARLDIGGDGIIEGYLLQLVFAPRSPRACASRTFFGGAVVCSRAVEARLRAGHHDVHAHAR